MLQKYLSSILDTARESCQCRTERNKKLLGIILCLNLVASYYYIMVMSRPRHSMSIPAIECVRNVTSLVNKNESLALNYTEVSNGSLFLYSAFTRCNNRQLILTLLMRHYSTESRYIGCFRQHDGSITNSLAMHVQPFWIQSNLSIAELIFELPDTIKSNDFMATVVRTSTKSGINDSRTNNDELCPTGAKMYIRPQTPFVPKTYQNITEAYCRKLDQNCIIPSKRHVDLDRYEPFSVAICAKIAFGNLNPHLVIEWMEYHIKMGVSLVVVYTYNLNTTTRRVFQYYEDKGYMAVIEFDLPLTETFKRKPGDASVQSWIDEQVPLNDCYERLRLFKYVLVTDFDEFLIPLKDSNFESLINRLGNIHPAASSYHFHAEFHITDWTEFNKSHYEASSKGHREIVGVHSLFVDRFQEHFGASKCCTKYIIIPGRGHFIAPLTHVLQRYIHPYTRGKIANTTAVVHHYRKYLRKWKDERCISRHTDLDHVKQGSNAMRLFDDNLRDIIYERKNFHDIR